MKRTLIIAEPGSTAEGQLENYYRLIDAAADFGADIFKNQWVSNPDRLCQRRNAHAYKWTYSKLKYPQSWHSILARRCEQSGLEYACTVYLPEDVPIINQYVQMFKIAGFEAHDSEFVTLHEQFGKPIILSLSMGNSNPASINAATYILHCVQAYPAILEEMNLSRISALKQQTGKHVGLSDHSHHLLTGAIAVAAGAEMVEFHYRLQKTHTSNADYDFSFEPQDAKSYIDNIHIVEKMMGHGKAQAMPCESEMLPYRVMR